MGVETIAVTGATGFVGRHIVDSLLDRGRRVRALVRDESKAASVLPASHPDLTLVQGSLARVESLHRLMQDASGVVHSVGIIRERPSGQTFQRVHVRGTQRVIDAASSNNCRRFVHVSALGVRDEGVCEYQRSKFEAETAVRSSGLTWTILRPSLIVGNGSDFVDMARGWITGRRFPHFFVPYFQRHVGGPPLPKIGEFEDATLMPIDVRDVANAAAESLDRPEAAGEVIPLVGARRTTMPDLLRELRDHVPLARKNAPFVPAPANVAAIKARVAGWLGMKQLLPFDEGMALMAAEDSTADATRQREILGIEPSDHAEALSAAGSA